MKETPMGAQPVRNNFGEEKRKRGREAKLLSSFCTAQLSSQLSPLTSTLLTCMGKSCFLPNFEGTQGTWRISLRTKSNSKTLYVFHFQPMLRKEELWQSQWNSFRSCCLWPVSLRLLSPYIPFWNDMGYRYSRGWWNIHVHLLHVGFFKHMAA